MNGAWTTTASKGNGGPVEKAPPGTHPAVLVALIDLGNQWQSAFSPGEAGKYQHRLYWVYELPMEKKANGESHLIAIDLTWSLNEKAKMRQFIESRLGRKIAEGEKYDVSAELGQPFRGLAGRNVTGRNQCQVCVPKIRGRSLHHFRTVPAGRKVAGSGTVVTAVLERREHREPVVGQPGHKLRHRGRETIEKRPLIHVALDDADARTNPVVLAGPPHVPRVVAVVAYPLPAGFEQPSFSPRSTQVEVRSGSRVVGRADATVAAPNGRMIRRGRLVKFMAHGNNGVPSIPINRAGQLARDIVQHDSHPLLSNVYGWPDL